MSTLHEPLYTPLQPPYRYNRLKGELHESSKSMGRVVADEVHEPRQQPCNIMSRSIAGAWSKQMQKQIA